MLAAKRLVFNGILAETGDYHLSPRTPGELVEAFRRMPPPPVRRAVLPQFVTDDLADVGWGVVFPRSVSPAVREALAPLLERRRQQAGDRFRDDLVYRGEDLARFLEAHGAVPGAVNPRRLPFYLLLVGGPDEIPFEFQYLLDVQHAVGRLSFETAEEYAHYAAGVVASERGEVEKPRRVELFGVRNWDDPNTALCEHHLVDPLATRLSGHEGWTIGTTRREEACKARLAGLLGGQEAPAILLTASHGAVFQTRDRIQLEDQGALVCYEWPGPESWCGRLRPRQYFAARDVSQTADLRGSMVFLFACFSAGTPRLDAFSRSSGSLVPDSAPRDFLAALPRRLLAHPRGGALAVVGHVDQAWPHSFQWRGAGSRIGHIESILREWMSGRPAGLALEVMAQRHASLATILTEASEQRRVAGPSCDVEEDAFLWMAYHDARSYVLLGDPAVRLPAGRSPEPAADVRGGSVAPAGDTGSLPILPTFSGSGAAVSGEAPVSARPFTADVRPERGSGFRRSIAAVIGIDRYEHGIPPLHNARRDAEAVADILRELHGYSVLPPLVEDVGRRRLLGLYDSLGERVGEEDRLLIYFAGHGLVDSGSPGLEGYLVPQDARPGGDRDRQLVSMAALKESLSKLPCRHLLLILDCCFAGAFRSATPRALDFFLSDRVFREQYDCFVRDPAWQVLTSAAHDQKAHDALWGVGERGGSRHSPFAAALIEGLRGAADLVPAGGDGLITVTELYLYLRRRIETPTDRQGERQTPGLWPMRGRGEFVFLVPGRNLDLEPAPELDPAAAPYRGLKSFGEAHADLFFGREESVGELVRRVDEQPLTVIVGASGSGKSSLLRAGLIPALRSRGNWQVAALPRPGATPWEALAGDLPPVPGLDWWSDPLETFSSWSRGSPEFSILMAVDSFEEMPVRDDRPAGRRFERLLSSLLAFQDQVARSAPETLARLRVVLVLRSDFESLFANGPLAGRWREARWPMPPWSVRDLRRSILGPAFRRLLFFEDELVETLVEEVSGMPGALPLLSFALDQLYRAYLESDRTDRTLTRGDYERLGRVAGSLHGQAEKLYSDLEDSALRGTLQRVLLRMVDLEAGGPVRSPVSRRELDSENLAENRRVDEVLQRLVEARLVVRDGNLLEPAHGSLLLAWDRLRRWIETSAEELLLRRRVAQAAGDWVSGRGALWVEEPRLAQLWEGAEPARWLNRREVRFARASRRRRRWRRGLRAGLTVGVVVALTAGFTAFRQQEGEKHALRFGALSEKLAAEAQEIAGEGPGLGSHRALLLARQAYNFSSRTPALHQEAVPRALREALSAALVGGLVYEGFESDRTPVALSPGGSQLVIGLADRSLRLDLEGAGQRSRRLPAGVGPARALAWHRRGELWVSGHETGHLCWSIVGDEATGEMECLAGEAGGPLVALAFAPWQGEILVSVGQAPDGGRLDRWSFELDGSRPQWRGPSLIHRIEAAPVALALTPAGEAFIALAGRAGVVRFDVRDEDNPRRLADLPGDSFPSRLAVRADGTALAGIAEGGTFLQWFPDFPGEPLASDEALAAIAFDPRGEGFMAADREGALTWRSGLYDEAPRRFASFCEGPVDDLAFSSDGGALAVTCDRAVRVWRRGEPEWALVSDGGAEDLAFRACRILRRDFSLRERSRQMDVQLPFERTCPGGDEPTVD